MKTKAEVLDMLDETLNTAADAFELLRAEDFGDEEAYWRARRCVSEAGGIVCAEYSRLLDIRRESA